MDPTRSHRDLPPTQEALARGPEILEGADVSQHSHTPARQARLVTALERRDAGRHRHPELDLQLVSGLQVAYERSIGWRHPERQT
ncbi:MAG TPA: hypothetical protein VII01_18225 [Solirubrobacteraceae bacterium]